jgi:branched-subunit amino acid ABC-type transport system permease component
VHELLPFIVVGLTAGSVYGLAATGLVLTYRTSGIFNFAHGSVAAVGAYAFYELYERAGLPWPVAALICLGGVAPLLGLALERLSAALADARPAMQIVATLGLLLLVQGLAAGMYGAEARFVKPFLPAHNVSVAGTRVGVDQLIVIGLAAVGSFGLAWLLRRTRLGSAMRALVDDPDLLSVAGWNPTAVRRMSWFIGSAFAVASGILIAPTLSLDAVLLSFLVVQAFGAAALGRFTSLPLTYAGGLAIGVASSLLTKQLSSSHSVVLQGLVPSLPFLVLFAVLVFGGRRLRVAARTTREAHAEGRALPRPARYGLAAVMAAVVLAVPSLSGPRLPVFISAGAMVVVFISMVVLINLSGQVSLCHAAFAALGATTFSHLTTGAGLPWLAALVLAGLLTIPLGAVVAIPAIRLSGLYLALATFGLGILVQRVAFSSGFMFGPLGTRVTPRPAVLGLAADRRFFYLVAVAAATTGVLAFALCRSRLGRLLRAMADSPLALSTFGLSVNVTRVLVFCVSAAIAGAGGALAAAAAGSANAVAFGPTQSLLWLAALAVGGRGLVKPPIVAAAGLAVAPAYFPTLFGEWGAAIFGAAALAVALDLGGRLRFDQRLHRWADASSWRLAKSPVTARLEGAAP